MIVLQKATYCENCPEFEAVTEKLFSDGQIVQTKVYCKNINTCRSIYRHIKEQAEREGGAGMRTPHDDKIDAFAYSLAREGKPAYLPQLYETEDEPEAAPVEWPKENPHKKPAIKWRVDFNPLIKGLWEAAAALKELTKAAAAFNVKISSYPNKRVKHLAKHAKKARVRKKNINRITKDITAA